MAEYIDSNTLSKLRAISILEVADELGMGLRYHNALCISHNDTHPSLHFWTSTNTCHCFACGWGGDGDETGESLFFGGLPMAVQKIQYQRR